MSIINVINDAIITSNDIIGTSLTTSVTSVRNDRYRLITELIIGTSLLQNNYSKYTTGYSIQMHVVFRESITK